MKTEKHTVKRDGKQNLKFSGECLARVTTCDTSGDPDRWTDLALYRTAKGAIVCEHIEHSNWANERNHHRACIIEGTELTSAYFLRCALDFFDASEDSLGATDLAKELFAAAGVDSAKHID